jgi:hypothetical protein
MTRLFIANTTAATLARIMQTLGLSGTASNAIGFGAWGVEPTAIVEFGELHGDELDDVLRVLFSEFPEEQAIYVVRDSIPYTALKEGGFAGVDA